MTSAAFAYIWTYEVRAGCEEEFEALYNGEGAWARLFRRSAGYLGTDLLRDRKEARRYVTVDRWLSDRAHREFVAAHEKELAELDRRGERLTTKETCLGDFEIVQPGT